MEESGLAEEIVVDKILFEQVWSLIGEEQNAERKRDIKRQVKNNVGKDNYIGLTFDKFRKVFFDVEVKDMKIKELEQSYKKIEKKYSVERAKRLNGETQSSYNGDYYQKKIKEMQDEINHYRLINQLFCATMPSDLKDDIREEYLKKDRKKNYRKIFLKHCENTKVEFPFENYVTPKKKVSLLATRAEKDSDDEDDIELPPNITVVSESDSEDEEP
jgi:hypothetical protein